MRLRRESGGLDRRKEGVFIANQNELRNKFELDLVNHQTPPFSPRQSTTRSLRET